MSCPNQNITPYLKSVRIEIMKTTLLNFNVVVYKKTASKYNPSCIFKLNFPFYDDYF